MNTYVSDEIKAKWPNYEFIGIPYTRADGKRYIRAHSKFFDCTHFYSFDDDAFYFDTRDIGCFSNNNRSGSKKA